MARMAYLIDNPAIPVTFNKLSENGVIVIDDTKNFPESKKLVQNVEARIPRITL